MALVFIGLHNPFAGYQYGLSRGAVFDWIERASELLGFLVLTGAFLGAWLWYFKGEK
jgi:hypothetical protein